MDNDSRQKPSAATPVDAVLIYATFPTHDEAMRIATVLVESGLIACANILPAMTSVYVWQGKRHADGEVAVILKTRRALAERVVAEARALHPYENPALLILPVEGGSEPFLRWIGDQCTPRGAMSD